MCAILSFQEYLRARPASGRAIRTRSAAFSSLLPELVTCPDHPGLVTPSMGGRRQPPSPSSHLRLRGDFARRLKLRSNAFELARLQGRRSEDSRLAAKARRRAPTKAVAGISSSASSLAVVSEENASLRRIRGSLQSTIFARRCGLSLKRVVCNWSVQ